MVQYSLCQQARWVGKVDQPGIRTQTFHVMGNFQSYRYGTQGVGKPAGAGGLLTDTMITKWNPFIPDTGVQESCAELCSNKVSIFQCFFPVRSCMNAKIYTGLFHHPSRKSSDDIQFFLSLWDIDQIKISYRKYSHSFDKSFDQFRCITGTAAYCCNF